MGGEGGTRPIALGGGDGNGNFFSGGVFVILTFIVPFILVATTFKIVGISPFNSGRVLMASL